jgi:hypothetical protein
MHLSTVATYDRCSQNLQKLETEVPPAEMEELVTTLLKIITNITQKPMDPELRKLQKHSDFVQEKILRYHYAIHFLVAAGFADHGEYWKFKGFDKD